jgi:hypothetical protein
MSAAGRGLGELGSCAYIASSPGAFGVRCPYVPNPNPNPGGDAAVGRLATFARHASAGQREELLQLLCDACDGYDKYYGGKAPPPFATHAVEVLAVLTEQLGADLFDGRKGFLATLQVREKGFCLRGFMGLFEGGKWGCLRGLWGHPRGGVG